jgi:two-component system NtrC family response regulator
MKTDQDKTKPMLLLVEDDAEIREQMKWGLASDYTVVEAHDRSTAVALVKQAHPALVTLDLGLPPHPDDPTEGLATLDELLAIEPLTKVIVITGNGEHKIALDAIQRGAYDYLQKPVQLESLRIILQRSDYLAKLERENCSLQEQLDREGFHEILGGSPPMQDVFKTIRRVSGSDTPVLIVGESGTGKELVARAIHQESSRGKGPFIPINCSAIPETLIESELFGYEKGAFTGANARRKGRIEAAQGGSLFLDEIGELPLLLQVKLLRFLQDRCIQHIGGQEDLIIDTRVIAATNVNLEKAIAGGRFREDLYYRLNVVTIVLPPLRERGEDVQLLANALLQRYVAQHAKKIRGFSRQAAMALAAHAWPGNVRELQNRINRAVIMAEGLKLTPEDLQLEWSSSLSASSGPRTLREARSAVEKDLIRQILAKHQGNISRAAVELGVSRPTLHELIARYGLKH